MATQVRQQLDRKIAAGPRPTPPTVSPSLWPTKEERKAMKAQKMVEEAKEKVAVLRAAGISPVVSVEAED